MIRYLKPGVFTLSTIPFILILYKIFFNKLGPEPVKEITSFTGEWTLIFICLTLSMSPLKKITNLILFINLRRMLGLFIFFYAISSKPLGVSTCFIFNISPKRFGFNIWL